MALLDRIVERLGWSGPLRRQDRPLWAAARSLDDLGELTARWLEGRIQSQPGYYGPVDVDEDDAPGLTDTLVALNRAGYLTNGSQAGFDGTGYDGAHWWQHAAVDGFASPATTDRLRQALDGTEYQAIVHDCKGSRWGRGDEGVLVTYRDGQPVTDFGQQLGRATIAGNIYAGCCDEAIDAVCAAKQVTVYDPVPGRNTMWPVLREAADQHLREATSADNDGNDEAGHKSRAESVQPEQQANDKAAASVSAYDDGDGW